jgi:hypothetical protein
MHRSLGDRRLRGRNVCFAALLGCGASFLAEACGGRIVLEGGSDASPDRAIEGRDGSFDSGDAGDLPKPVVTLFTGTGPCAIAVNATNVYWTDNAAGTVMSIPRNGGAATTIASNGMPGAIALDSTDVYWVGNDSISDSVLKAPLAGGGDLDAATLTTGYYCYIYGGYGSPGCDYHATVNDITVNAANVYYTESNHIVGKVPVDSDAGETIAEISRIPYAIAVDSKSVYFTEGPGLSEDGFGFDDAGYGDYAYDGGNEEDAGDAGDAGEVVILDAGLVLKMSLGGGAIQTLASGLALPENMALDEESVYFTDAPGDAGIVAKVPIAGGARSNLAFGRVAPGALAVDATSVYWVEKRSEGGVYKVPLGGGSITTLATGQNLPCGIAVDSTSVYWTNFGDGTVMKTAK